METDAKLYIKDLNPKTRRGYLCVRVMRKWNYDGNIPGGSVVYIGLVLTDEQGKSIYAQIPQNDVERLGSALLLHEVYTLRKFAVRVCRPTYVPFDADLMIQMTSYTTVTPSKVPQAKFPALFYNITAFKDIRTVGSATTKYIDVLGIVVSEAQPRTIYIKATDRVSSLKEIVIQDLSGAELTATLWDDHVKNFELKDPSSNQPLESVVILFCGCLPKKIFNKTQINVGNASSWFINPDISEAQPLYERLKQHPVTICRPTSSEQIGQPSAQPKILEHKTVAEMNALDPYQFPDVGCKCTVKITEIPAEQIWWYMGCEMCKKRLWNQGGSYYCSACKWSTAIPLYKLQFIAADDTGDAKFFCYDVVARQIVRRNCDSLLRSLNNSAGLPEQILRAIGRSFTFTVTLTDQCFQSPDSRVYLVDSTVFRAQPQDSPLPALPPPGTPCDAVQDAPISELPMVTHSASTERLAPHTVKDQENPALESTVLTCTPEASPSASGIVPTLKNKKQSSGTKHGASRPSASNARKKLKYDNADVEVQEVADQSADVIVATDGEIMGAAVGPANTAQGPKQI